MMRAVPAASSVDMTTTLAGLELPSPVLTASGCAAAGREIDQFVDITTIGGVVTKSVMREARSGRATPRMAETPSGMLNGIGLQGPGIDSFIEKDLAWLERRGARTIVSIAGGTFDEYQYVAARLAGAEGVAAIEVNISCPNVAERGLVFACDPMASARAVSIVRNVTPAHIPVLAKLSPDVTDITAIARAVVDAGASGVSLINTLLGMVIDTTTLKPRLSGRTGGLSGPAIRPVAVRAVYQVRAMFPDLPILGMGGIRTGLDALEFLAAGANAVSVGTVVFNDPMSLVRIHDELADALAERGYSSLREVVSAAHL